MKHKLELEKIQEFIRNFNPEDFSSTADWQDHLPDETKRHSQVSKFKARIQRKKQMEESFLRGLDKENFEDSDVTITQEQIDELLATL